MMTRFPDHFRVHLAPTALIAWVQLRKPLTEERDAIAIARDTMARELPHVDVSAFDWSQATVTLGELRQYAVRVPLRSTTLGPPGRGGSMMNVALLPKPPPTHDELLAYLSTTWDAVLRRLAQ